MADSGGGFCADIQQKFREGKFKTYARWGGVVCVLGLFITCIFKVVSSCILNCLLGMLVSILIGIIELPFCCSCFPICRTVQVKLAVFEKYALRGVGYLGIGLGTSCLVMINGDCWYLTVWGALIMLDGIFYFIAHFRGETYEEEDGKMEGMGLNSNKIKTQAASKAMGIV